MNAYYFRKFILVLLAGQAVSLTLTGTGVFATLLNDHTGKDISTALTAGAYFFLSATVLPYVAYQPGFMDKVKKHWWKFVILSLGDVYGTYLQTVAFKYTSVASNQVCHIYVVQYYSNSSYSVVEVRCHHNESVLVFTFKIITV